MQQHSSRGPRQVAPVAQASTFASHAGVDGGLDAAAPLLLEGGAAVGCKGRGNG